MSTQINKQTMDEYKFIVTSSCSVFLTDKKVREFKKHQKGCVG